MTLIDDLRLCRSPAAAFALVGIYWGAFAALAPALKAQTGLSDGGFGAALLVAAVGAVMAMWLAPWMRARLGERASTALALGLIAVYLLPGLATGWASFALGMALASMASGTLDVVMNAEVSAIESRSRRPLMGLNHATFSFAYALSAVCAGLAREAGLAPFPILAGLAVAGLALTRVIARRPTHVTDSAEPDTRAAVPARLLVPAGLVILVAFLSEQATEGWSALHLERNHGASPALGALGPALLGLTMGIGRLSGQMLAARHAPSAISALGAATAAIGALLAAHAPTLGLSILGFAILGAGISVIVPMMFAHVGAITPDHQRVTAIARISVIGYAGFFVGPPMMGFLAEAWGLAVSFSAVALLLTAIPAILALTARAARRRTSA